MLFGVGLGPGDPKLITLKAIEVLKAVDEVIVPGRLAESLVRYITKPRVVSFPMGKNRGSIVELAKELVDRCARENVAFACLGDPMFYSTFHHLVEEMININPCVEIEVVPGISSFTAVFSRIKVFVDKPLLITTLKDDDIGYVVVSKATRPREICERLKKMEMKKFYIAERMFMDGERVEKIDRPQEKADYFTIIVGTR
ncbi:MAG: precorrin-2 methylase [Thermoprotei archaeon]|nr:MAG: precorrin-2 methylase [Thermoprotei archaeon]